MTEYTVWIGIMATVLTSVVTGDSYYLDEEATRLIAGVAESA